jgi:hypothetical protein
VTDYADLMMAAASAGAAQVTHERADDFDLADELVTGWLSRVEHDGEILTINDAERATSVLNACADSAHSAVLGNRDEASYTISAQYALSVAVDIAIWIIDHPDALDAVRAGDADTVIKVLCASWSNNIGAMFISDALTNDEIARAWHALAIGE